MLQRGFDCRDNGRDLHPFLKSFAFRNRVTIWRVLAAEREPGMRARKKPSIIPNPGLVLAVANHAAMGIALGLVFALILIRTPLFGVLALINLSDDPSATMATFVGTVILMFGIGAALTGFVLTMEDGNE
jgi:hypothetical protein